MQILASADEADRSHAEATGIHPLLGSLNQFGIVGQAEIVVCTKVQALFARNHDFRTLGAFNDTFTLVEAVGINLSQLFFQIFLKFSIHNAII